MEMLKKLWSPLGTVMSILILPLALYLGQKWIDRRLAETNKQVVVLTNTIQTFDSQLIDLRNQISNSGNENLSVINNGSHNLNDQTINELKPDFRQDSPKSKVVSMMIANVIRRMNGLKPCETSKAEEDRILNEANAWYGDAIQVLNTQVSEKAAAYFVATNARLAPGEGVKSGCSLTAYATQVAYQRYLESLREIAKGL